MMMTGCSSMSNTTRAHCRSAAGAAGGGIGHAVGNTAAGRGDRRRGRHRRHRRGDRQRHRPPPGAEGHPAGAGDRRCQPGGGPASRTGRNSAVGNGTADTLTINQDPTSPTVYHPTADQIVWLQQNGVHDSVITEMQATAARQPTVVYPRGPPTTVIVEDQPPVAVRSDMATTDGGNRPLYGLSPRERGARSKAASSDPHHGF